MKLKNLGKNVVVKMKSAKVKAFSAVNATLVAAFAATGQAYCITDNADIDINTIASNVMKVFFNCIGYVGIIMTAVGVIGILKNAFTAGDDTPGGSKGIQGSVKMTIFGLGMIAIRVILHAVGVDTNYKIV